MKVKDKVVAVTGGGNGIGRELVLELLRRDSGEDRHANGKRLTGGTRRT